MFDRSIERSQLVRTQLVRRLIGGRSHTINHSFDSRQPPWLQLLVQYDSDFWVQEKKQEGLEWKLPQEAPWAADEAQG